MFQFARFSYLFLLFVLTLVACDTETSDQSTTGEDPSISSEEPAQKTGQDLFNELKAKAEWSRRLRLRL
ncbi:MAG: hypothetical protein AAFU60_09015 [Bacteroidota bacterium]